jgi:uncharacterized protein YndB with AHSA1/START domain
MGVQIGALNVRRSILINAPPRRVWAEFVSLEAMRAWFGRGHLLHVYEPRLGGGVDLSVEIDGERRHYGGRVLVFDADREVTFESNWAAPHSWPVPTLITIRITPLYEVSLVEIFHHGFERLGGAAADNLEGYEQGWDVKHLTALRAIVER